jgi:4-hydroxybenzoate polyprenyltransferase/phosphoglycolate phosphatase-like HAD superfamily hydrolase
MTIDAGAAPVSNRGGQAAGSVGQAAGSVGQAAGSVGQAAGSVVEAAGNSGSAAGSPDKTANPSAAASTERPLVVDLDGTLIRSDLLLESFFALLGKDPLKALSCLAALREGKASLKSKLADAALVEVATLPLNEDVLALIKREKARGRRVYLASASDRRYVERLAEHLGLFDGVFGSGDGVNLAGEAKAEQLCREFGEKGFDYIGDAPVDEAVWRRSHGVLIAGASTGHLAAVRRWAPHAEAVGTRSTSLKPYVKAIRAHQWLKNVLVLIPALAAHEFGAPLVASIAAFFAFSFCASSVYILNDLVDLDSDRAHPRKRSRPFAAGTIPIIRGAALFPIMLGAALVIALFLPGKFVLVLMGYFALTCAYSFVLKRQAMVDVVTLACLYGARLLAGSAAADVPVSAWLAAFAIFVFMCLALVKRCSELSDRIASGKSDPPGRGYRLGDLAILQSMAVASGYVAVLVLALYFNSPAVTVLYTHYNRLWLICVLVLFWVSRTVLLTHRGEMHDDPVVFAVTDRVSQAIALGCVVVAFASL